MRLRLNIGDSGSALGIDLPLIAIPDALVDEIACAAAPASESRTGCHGGRRRE